MLGPNKFYAYDEQNFHAGWRFSERLFFPKSCESKSDMLEMFAIESPLWLVLYDSYVCPPIGQLDVGQVTCM